MIYRKDALFFGKVEKFIPTRLPVRALRLKMLNSRPRRFLRTEMMRVCTLHKDGPC